MTRHGTGSQHERDSQIPLSWPMMTCNSPSHRMPTTPLPRGDRGDRREPSLGATGSPWSCVLLRDGLPPGGGKSALQRGLSRNARCTPSYRPGRALSTATEDALWAVQSPGACTRVCICVADLERGWTRDARLSSQRQVTSHCSPARPNSASCPPHWGLAPHPSCIQQPCSCSQLASPRFASFTGNWEARLTPSPSTEKRWSIPPACTPLHPKILP